MNGGIRENDHTKTCQLACTWFSIIGRPKVGRLEPPHINQVEPGKIDSILPTLLENL